MKYFKLKTVSESTPLMLAIFSFLPFLSCTSTAKVSLSAKAHHTINAFQNVYGPDEHPGLLKLIRWRWQRLWKNRPSPENYQFPMAENDPAFLQTNREKDTVTWIGHATMLLQLQGKNILTDPVFSRRASPVQWAGPKRVISPGIALEDLPAIDMVVISHDHYDALDKDSILRLYLRPNGADTVFIVPLGLKKWFIDLGIRNVIELDWWEQFSSKGLCITAMPVQHWSKRNLFSKNKSLWSGWAVQSDRFRFFFGGDSGYTPHFKEIGDRLGPFDLAAIPIGAYEPRWFMQQHHMNPEEAIQVHEDIKAKMSIGIHGGPLS